MNIGFDAKRIFQNRAGLGNYSRNTISILSSHFPDHSYLLFAPKKTNLFIPPQNVTTILPHSPLMKLVRPAWRRYVITNLLNKYKVDIYHGLSHELPVGIEKSGALSVVTMHDLIFLRYPRFFRSTDRRIYQKKFRHACRVADKIIAISHQTKSDITHFFGTDPDKITVIYQTCHSQFYQPVNEKEKEQIQQKYSLPHKFILSVGTIEQRKNHLGLLKGIVHAGIEIPVVIIGRPSTWYIEVEKYVMKKGMQKQVIFLQDVSNEELPVFYQLAEMMVYPSFFEGFGLPVLEAQASGCPVVTSNISSLPEAGGDAARYINPENEMEIGNAISNVLSDTNLRNEMVEKGKRNAENFREAYVAKVLMNFYQQLRDERGDS